MAKTLDEEIADLEAERSRLSARVEAITQELGLKYKAWHAARFAARATADDLSKSGSR